MTMADAAGMSFIAGVIVGTFGWYLYFRFGG